MFFQGKDRWTSDASQAENFQTSPKAILYASEHGLNGVEVYWDFDDPEYNVRLPISMDTDRMVA
jgi:hypothetical protein